MPPLPKRKTKETEVETSDSDSAEDNLSDKYKPYRITDYNRRYPEENVAGQEFVVFIESSTDSPIGTRDMINLSTLFSRFIKGIKYLKKVNKTKIAVVFDRPTLANGFLDNTTFLKDNKLSASIPAASTEVTGIINSVPITMSNKQIFKAITITNKKIISVRRIMRKGDGGLVPTQTVAITFASCMALPDFVYIKMWRFPVHKYIPPIKQCFKCLRYGHLAKYCHNSQRCSICAENHKYTDCSVPGFQAKCVHCEGNHPSISKDCPVKQKKIQENKTKFLSSSYAAVAGRDFPSLNKTLNSKDIINLMLTDQNTLTLLLECITKIITLNKTENKTICSKTITDILKDTVKDKNKI